MLEEGFVSESTVVLTTQERMSWFSAVLGDGVDARFDPVATCPLDEFLGNVATAGGKMVVLDEDHFLSVEEMVSGLAAYLNDATRVQGALRIVIVCSERQPGDEVLAFLTMYCGLYDIVYGRQGPLLSKGLAMVLRRRNTRLDVLELLDSSIQTCKGTSSRAEGGIVEEVFERGPMRGPLLEWLVGKTASQAKVTINIVIDPICKQGDCSKPQA